MKKEVTPKRKGLLYSELCFVGSFGIFNFGFDLKALFRQKSVIHQLFKYIGFKTLEVSDAF